MKRAHLLWLCVGLSALVGLGVLVAWGAGLSLDSPTALPVDI